MRANTPLSDAVHSSVAAWAALVFIAAIATYRQWHSVAQAAFCHNLRDR